MNEREIRRELDRLDREDVVEIFALTPERTLPARTTLRKRRRPSADALRRLGAGLLTTVLGMGAIGFWVVRDTDWTKSATRGLPAAPTTYPDAHYAFMDTQPDGSGRPVGWNPCQYVAVRLNPDHAPERAARQVREAIDIVDRVSGLHLVYGAPTGKTRTTAGTTAGTITVSFTTSDQDDSLDGDVANAGSSAATTANGLRYYRSGAVTIDYRAYQNLAGWNQVAVLLHELGHAVGLGHVDDDSQLMSAHGQGTATYQHGDLTGLAKLGALPCD